MNNVSKFCCNRNLKPYECLALKYLTNRSNKRRLLTAPTKKNKENMINYLNNHLYIYLNNIDNRFFPFDLKRFGFINNTTEIIPKYTYGVPGNHYFRIDVNGGQKFFTGFYKLTQTSTKYIIQIDTIYVASENGPLIDDRYISITPNSESNGSTIYFYYKTGSYDGIATVLINKEFPPYITGDTSNTAYFVRKNGMLPKNRMELLSGYTIENDIITFENNDEESQIIKCKILSSWKDNIPTVDPKLGDIVFSVKIEISKQS